MKVIIAGSKSITNISLVELACYQAIQRWKRNGCISYISEVVCGESPGVDQLGKLLAYKAKKPVKSFQSDIEGMVNYAQALIAIWDGKSQGTKTVIDLAKKKRLKVFVFQVNTGDESNEQFT